MTMTEKLLMTKFANQIPEGKIPNPIYEGRPPEKLIDALRNMPGSVGAGLATTAMVAPWNTGRALIHKMRGTNQRDEIGKGVSKDLGRGIGAAVGGMTANGLAHQFNLPVGGLGRLGMLLSGIGLGGTLGHMKGRHVGDELFPGSVTDRVKRLISNF